MINREGQTGMSNIFGEVKDWLELLWLYVSTGLWCLALVFVKLEDVADRAEREGHWMTAWTIGLVILFIACIAFDLVNDSRPFMIHVFKWFAIFALIALPLQEAYQRMKGEA